VVYKSEKNPYHRSGYWGRSSEYPILNWVKNVVWFTRMFSPGAWIYARYQVVGPTGKSSTNPVAVDRYIILSNVLVFLFYVAIPAQWYGIITLAVATILLLEPLNYHVDRMIIRKSFDPEYRPSNPSRSILISIFEYFKMIFLFAAIYLSIVPGEFIESLVPALITLNKVKALEFSAVTLCTVGFGSLAPQPGSTAGIIAGIEGLIGVLYMGALVATAIGRQE